MTARRRAAGPSHPLLPPLVALAGAVLVVAGVFMPWYRPDLAEPLAPNSVTGWDATVAARIALAGAVLCILAAIGLALDSRDMVALDTGGIGLLSVMAVAGAAVAVAAVGFRAVFIPDPADELSRQIGLYLAVLAALAALGGALVQLLVAGGGPRRIRRR